VALATPADGRRVLRLDPTRGSKNLAAGLGPRVVLTFPGLDCYLAWINNADVVTLFAAIWQAEAAMQSLGVNPSHYGLDRHGIQNVNQAYWNLGTAALVENAIRRREGLLAAGGAFVVRTASTAGRSPDDKFVVKNHRRRTGSGGGRSIAPSTSPASTRYTGAS